MVAWINRAGHSGAGHGVLVHVKSIYRAGQAAAAGPGHANAGSKKWNRNTPAVSYPLASIEYR